MALYLSFVCLHVDVSVIAPNNYYISSLCFQLLPDLSFYRLLTLSISVLEMLKLSTVTGVNMCW